MSMSMHRIGIAAILATCVAAILRGGVRFAASFSQYPVVPGATRQPAAIGAAVQPGLSRPIVHGMLCAGGLMVSGLAHPHRLVPGFPNLGARHGQ